MHAPLEGAEWVELIDFTPYKEPPTQLVIQGHTLFICGFVKATQKPTPS